MTDDGASDFPREIGTVAARSLALHGFTTFGDLACASESELLALHGVGPKAIRILGEHLAERGLSFAERGD
ncbi:hypothetical protein D9V29_04095 [Mycetocola manganoxydans]|uniref:DNA-binding protein n=1 Tax=Mycetocola manganoxydans TaxID=699879 RepID=A0A3L6ZX47_9MICO|nr:hypothetical protein [Mycetocola manganoxydans]RLP72344.1 hypothetical protein D9V29_04095 [Mycetocola manganoxydans]GHD40854.1 hypothetical protein GCM10008097_05410 [Mycetocola manganoxydans]